MDAQQERNHAERYTEFYKQISYDSEAPLAYTHNRVEGRSGSLRQLLYIPARRPFDLWNRDKRGGLKLYVKRVFIMDDARAPMPVYLRFVKGVIDSADLPLNVSRELLQESRDVKTIREGYDQARCCPCSKIAGRQRRCGQARQYAAFWADFGQVLKKVWAKTTPTKTRIAEAAALRVHDAHRRRACRWPTT